MSDINDKLAGLRIDDSCLDFSAVRDSMAWASEALKSIRTLEESIKLAGGGVSSISDRLAGLGMADSAVRNFAGVRDSMTSAMDALKGVGGLNESIRLAGAAADVNSIANPFSGRKIARDLAGGSGLATSAIDALNSARGLSESLRLAGGTVDTDTVMNKLAQQISAQQIAIASLRPLIPEIPELLAIPEPVRMPELHLPPNPLHETNKRLASIELRFNRMESIALNGAEIATGLQAFAATFLTKFEKASANNDRTSSRAIWLGVVAVLIAVAMPVAQVLYTELWRAPADSASQQAAIADMKNQIKGLKDNQRAAADEFSKVLSSGNSELTTTLRDIRKLLGEQQRRSAAPSETKP